MRLPLTLSALPLRAVRLVGERRIIPGAGIHGDTVTTSTTHLIATNHATDDSTAPDEYAQTEGRCGFCGQSEPGLPISEAVNHDYFTDDPLMQADTGHVCRYCAYCMNADRALKQGHWIATATAYERIPTAELPEVIEGIREREYEPPYALYVTRDPILSQHSYHWTTAATSAERLLCTYARETVRIEWAALDGLVDAIENLRWHGSRLDAIRSGEPRVATIASIGRERYRAVDGVIAPYRRTPELELALTLSRAADDQERGQTRDGNATLTQYT